MNPSEKHWNELHASARFRPLYPSEHVVRFLLATRSLLQKDSPLRFLDIGTGAGRHMVLAASLGFMPVGVDISWEGLRHARQRLLQANAVDALASASMTSLPFRNQSFDAILSYGVFCYGVGRDMAAAIDEAWRVLAPGGSLFVVTRTTNDYRFGKGRELEPHTFQLDIDDTNEMGTLQHFLAAEDLPNYFAKFAELRFEKTETTFSSRTRLDSDWLITARK